MSASPRRSSLPVHRGRPDPRSLLRGAGGARWALSVRLELKAGLSRAGEASPSFFGFVRLGVGPGQETGGRRGAQGHAGSRPRLPRRARLWGLPGAAVSSGSAWRPRRRLLPGQGPVRPDAFGGAARMGAAPSLTETESGGQGWRSSLWPSGPAPGPRVPSVSSARPGGLCRLLELMTPNPGWEWCPLCCSRKWLLPFASACPWLCAGRWPAWVSAATPDCGCGQWTEAGE